MFQIDTLLSSCCFISVNNVLQLIYDDVRPCVVVVTIYSQWVCTYM